MKPITFITISLLIGGLDHRRSCSLLVKPITIFFFFIFIDYFGYTYDQIHQLIHILFFLIRQFSFDLVAKLSSMLPPRMVSPLASFNISYCYSVVQIFNYSALIFVTTPLFSHYPLIFFIMIYWIISSNRNLL